MVETGSQLIGVGGREGSSNKCGRRRDSREDATVSGGMLRLCCCPRTAVHPAPPPAPAAPALPLDLVADLPPKTRYSHHFQLIHIGKSTVKFTIHNDISHYRNYSAHTGSEEITQLSEKKSLSEKSIKSAEREENDLRLSRSPSIEIEEYSQKSNPVLSGRQSRTQSSSDKNGSNRTEDVEPHRSVTASPASRASSRKASLTPAKSRSGSPATAKSGNSTPEPTSVALEPVQIIRERDVRAALAECIVPARHEDWEAIVTGLTETERLAADAVARAPAASWRAAIRGVTVHVRSLRSRVARVACRTVGALFEHRGRVLDPELEEAVSALLERCADANRFLRGDATEALGRVACGSAIGRAAVALSRRGTTQRAGPVRAAAAAALARLVRHVGSSRTLDLPMEPRTVLLRATGELLTDACSEARMHARHLAVALAEDVRFRPLLKEAMPVSRYRAVEKLLDKLLLR